MEFFLDKSSELPYYDQIKNQLTAALHMGELKNRHRLPTVRLLARSLGLNPKTVLKIYHRLQKEGLLEIRVGSGVQVAAIERNNYEQSYFSSIVSMVNRHVEEARRFQFAPENYVALLQQLINPRKRQEISCLVVECNTEQIRLFAAEISAHTGATTYPLLVNDLLSNGRRARALLARAAFLITTDFHWKEVEPVAKWHHKIPLKVRLKPEFVSTLIECARKGNVLMVVSNLDFFANFRAALRNLGYQALLGRIHAVLDTEAARLSAMLARARYVYVSPLCASPLPTPLPRQIHRIQFQEHLSSESLHSISTALMTHHVYTLLPATALLATHKPGGVTPAPARSGTIRQKN